MSKIFSGIYFIINLVNNKKYVGQSINIERRIKEHLGKVRGEPYWFTRENQLRFLTPIDSAIREFGISAFDWCVLENIANPKMLNRREKYWIKILRSGENKYGYNISKSPYRRKWNKFTSRLKSISN